MKKQMGTVVGLVFVIALSLSGAAWADENEVVALKGQVQDLNGKLESLENLVRSLQSRESAPTYVAPTPSGDGGFLRAAQDIQVSGYIDTQYSMALSDGTDHRTAAGLQLGATNPSRTFDTDQDSFSVNAVEIDFEKAANPEGGAGFRFDIQYGEDAEVVDFDATTAGAGGTQDELHLQQAYVEYVQPLSGWEGNTILPSSINIKAGRFVTLAGAEVIEARDNWNLSRSFAFGLAIPFTHTGLRTNFKMWNDFFDVYLGVNNGWDVSVDNNAGKTAELGLGYSLANSVNVFHSIYFGPERNNQVGHKRFLLGNVVSYDVSDKLAVKGEINYGNERRVGSVAPPTAAPFAEGLMENANWSSYTGYARYQFTDKFAFAYRLGLFRQAELTRTVLDTTLFEQTYTAEYLLGSNLTGRLEYRWDKSNNTQAFDTDSNQQTLGAQLIYSFA